MATPPATEVDNNATVEIIYNKRSKRLTKVLGMLTLGLAVAVTAFFIAASQMPEPGYADGHSQVGKLCVSLGVASLLWTFIGVVVTLCVAYHAYEWDW